MNTETTENTKITQTKEPDNNNKKKNSRIVDLTDGNPLKLIVGFALPMFAGMLFQQFYSIVDTMIVGRFLGVDALAGVGSTGSINFMIIGFVMGACSGFSIPISQRFGARDFKSMRSYYANSIYLAGFFMVVMTLVCTVFCGNILRAMHTPDNIYQYAFDYIFVIFLGIPVIYVYNLFSSAIRALGDSKAPVVFLVVSSFINIVLDLVFILVFHMGTIGAALATVISQAASGMLSILYIKKKLPILKLSDDEKRFSKRACEKLLAQGIPMGLQYSITAIGSAILQASVNTLGSVYVAAMTAGSRVGNFCCTPYDALGSTMATYGGQNVGAGKLDRLNKGLKSATVIGVIYSIAIFFVLFFFGNELTGLFVTTGADAEKVRELGRLFLVYNAAFYVPLLFVNIVRFLIQGMGYSGLAILAGVFEMIGRTIAALILIPYIGFAGAALASPIAWILADAFLFPAYFHVRNKLYKAFGRYNKEAA